MSEFINFIVSMPKLRIKCISNFVLFDSDKDLSLSLFCAVDL
jgi:hypothetical protein